MVQIPDAHYVEITAIVVSEKVIAVPVPEAGAVVVVTAVVEVVVVMVESCRSSSISTSPALVIPESRNSSNCSRSTNRGSSRSKISTPPEAVGQVKAVPILDAVVVAVEVPEAVLDALAVVVAALPEKVVQYK